VFKLKNILGLMSAVVLVGLVRLRGNHHRTVAGPDGAPFRAACVQARNAKNKNHRMVLSDNMGDTDRESPA